ncbi:MAG: class I SAM-dependent methyltransferase [Acidobacteria bacterium]|nr:MAG: class I SAM-dependent methyltransferase [Acidobacteriota bacterium]
MGSITATPMRARCGQILTMASSRFKSILRDFSHRSRTKKFHLFESLFRPRPEERVLDIGASGEVFLRYTFEDAYPYPSQIVAGGYDPREVKSARRAYPEPTYIVFDGCSLPFPDKAFDIVFSNAVIEHILGQGRQEHFAREVMRVGKSWFVTTPNYWYPFESHYHLPFIQFLPANLQRRYNSMIGTHIPKGQTQELGLLSARDLGRLFPSGSIEKVRVTFWPETLVAYYLDPERPTVHAIG